MKIKVIKLLLLFTALYFSWSWLTDNSCELDGCEREGKGWKNSYTLLDKGIADGGCYNVPCRPVGASGGYCSKSHAYKGM
jgi:hypothetical protein